MQRIWVTLGVTDVQVEQTLVDFERHTGYTITLENGPLQSLTLALNDMAAESLAEQLTGLINNPEVQVRCLNETVHGPHPQPGDSNG